MHGTAFAGTCGWTTTLAGCSTLLRTRTLENRLSTHRCWSRARRRRRLRHVHGARPGLRNNESSGRSAGVSGSVWPCRMRRFARGRCMCRLLLCGGLLRGWSNMLNRFLRRSHRSFRLFRRRRGFHYVRLLGGRSRGLGDFCGRRGRLFDLRRWNDDSRRARYALRRDHPWNVCRLFRGGRGCGSGRFFHGSRGLYHNGLCRSGGLGGFDRGLRYRTCRGRMRGVFL